MPRALRIEYADAWYHVMNRGLGCRPIFKTNQHRQIFLEIVKEAIVQFAIEVRSMLNAVNNCLAYVKFVAAGVDKEIREFYEKKNMPVILGSKEFTEKILKCAEDDKIAPSQSDYNKTRSLPSMAGVDWLCITYFKVDKSDLLKAHIKVNEARKMAIYGSRVWAKENNSVITKHYDCSSAANISNTVRNINERIKIDTKFANEVEKLRKKLIT
ncbi:MAG: hypothetical protein V4496_06575 [Pseudomonadota bacterium]